MNESSNIRIINDIHKELSESISHLLIKNKNIAKGNKIKKANNKNNKLDGQNIQTQSNKENINGNFVKIKGIKNLKEYNSNSNFNSNHMLFNKSELTERFNTSKQYNLLKNNNSKYFNRNYHSYDTRKNLTHSPNISKINKILSNTNYLFSNYIIEKNSSKMPNANKIINIRNKINPTNIKKIIKRNDHQEMINKKSKTNNDNRSCINNKNIYNNPYISFQSNQKSLNLSKNLASKKISNKNKSDIKNNISNMPKLIISGSVSYTNRNQKSDIFKLKEKKNNKTSSSLSDSSYIKNNMNIKIKKSTNTKNKLNSWKIDNIKNKNKNNFKKIGSTKKLSNKKDIKRKNDKKKEIKDGDKAENENENKKVDINEKKTEIKKDEKSQEPKSMITTPHFITEHNINILSKIEIDSIMGVDSYEKIKNDNQDSLFIMTNNSSTKIETNNISNYNLFLEESQNLNINNEKIFTFLGICDGHGDQGKTISNYLANRIPGKMKRYLRTISYNISKDNFSQEIEPKMKSIFQTINTRLNSMQSIDTSYSGSCFCSLLITPSSIISINVGNSKAIIGIPNNNSGDNAYIPYNLNYEHTSLIQNEKERIINNGGYVLYEKDEYDREYGPLKVWKKNSLLPGLLPTRTFGDKESSSIGIISEPEIQYFEMKDNFKFIVVGSNGLWSFISSEECVQIISKFYIKDDVHGAVNTIMNIAKSRWIDQKEEIIEDISIIVGFFKEFKL